MTLLFSSISLAMHRTSFSLMLDKKRCFDRTVEGIYLFLSETNGFSIFSRAFSPPTYRSPHTRCLYTQHVKRTKSSNTQEIYPLGVRTTRIDLHHLCYSSPWPPVSFT